MNTHPRSIVKGKKEDLRDILVLYASFENEELTKEETILADLEAGRLYLLKEGKKTLGVATVHHDVIESLFTKSRSYRKSDDLLERIGYRGEPLCILSGFAISPSRRRMGLGREFLQSLFARYKGSSWIGCIEKNDIHAALFFQKLGFFSLGVCLEVETLFQEPCIFYRTYKKEGLCSAAWW